MQGLVQMEGFGWSKSSSKLAAAVHYPQSCPCSDVTTSEHGQHPVHKVLKNALKLSHLSARSVPFQFCEHLSKEKGEN